jgi:Flp pilus assembly protein TadG
MTLRHTLRTQLRRLANDRSGGPALEFAIIAPILVVCLIFTFDLGNALQTRIRLGEAVRAGGLYATSYNDDMTLVATAVTNAVPDWTDVTVATPVLACYCWASSTGVFTTVTCSTVTSCASGSEMRRYVSISVSRPFSPILLTNISTIAFDHVARVQ